MIRNKIVVTRTYLVEDKVAVYVEEDIQSCEMEDSSFEKNAILLGEMITSQGGLILARRKISEPQIINIKREK